MARLGGAGRGWVRQGRLGQSWLGPPRPVEAWRGRPGTAWHGWAGHDTARCGWAGAAVPSPSRSAMAWPGRLGMARIGVSGLRKTRRGKAGEARQDGGRCGRAWQAWFGQERSGSAALGAAGMERSVMTVAGLKCSVHNAKPPAMRSTSLAAVSEPSRPMGGVLELLAKRKKHTPRLEARGLCHDDPDIRPQSSRGAAPSGADPAVDIAPAAAWVPNSIGRVDGAILAHQRRRGRAAHAPGAGRGGNSNRDAGGLARAADLRRGRGEG